MTYHKHHIFILAISSLLFLQKGQAILAQSHEGMAADTLAAMRILEVADSLEGAELYEAALEKIEESLPIYRKHGLWEKYISVYVKMAIICDYLDENQKAKYANLAVEEGEKHLPPDHQVLGKAYRQKAESHALLNDHNGGIPYAKKAIPIFRKHQLWTDEAWAELLLATAYYLNGESDSTRKSLDKVKQSDRNHELHGDVKSTLYQLYGAYFISTGDYEKAIWATQYSIDLVLNDSIIGELDSSFLSSTYQNMGFMQSYKGDYERALDNYVNALNWQSQQTRIDEPLVYYRIGEAYYKLRNYPEAIPYLKKSLNVSSKKNQTDHQGNQEKIAWQNMAECYRDMGNLQLAQESLAKAKAIPVKSNDHFIWELQGLLDSDAGKIDDAIFSFQKAIQVFKESKEREQFKYVLSRIHKRLGDAYWGKGKKTIALEQYQKAIASVSVFSKNATIYATPPLENIDHPVNFLKAIHAKAKAQAEMPEDPKALPAALGTYQVAVQWIDSLRGIYVTDQSELSWGKSFKEIYEGAVSTSWKLFEKTGDKQYLEDMFGFSEKSKAALLLETLKARQEQSAFAFPDSLRNREKDLAMDIAYHSQALNTAKEKRDSAKVILHQTYLSQKQLAMARHKEWMQKAYPVAMLGQKEAQLAEIQSTLVDEQTAMVAYFTGETHTFAFVITKAEIQVVLLHPDRNVIEAFQQTLHLTPAHSAEARRLHMDFNQKSHKAYLEVFGSIVSLLPERIKKLILIPDGYLSRMPFEVLNEVLVDETDLNFGNLPLLIYRYGIRYGYSAALLLNNKQQQQVLKANSNLLAFAPPYKQEGGQVERGTGGLRGTTQPLAGTASEVEAIKTYFHGKVETTETATVGAFRRQAKDYGILHLAMHGTADFSRPDFAFLIFSNIGTVSLEEAKLYNYEISQLALRSQLVVLSACETGVGQYVDGEGVFSLARGFMDAGVPSVVMSLWQVNDISTSELMPVFYRHLAKGLPKDEALHKAKLEYLKNSDPMKTHPFFWASFVLLGDEAPVKAADTNWYIWLGIGFLLVIGGYWGFRVLRA